MIRVAALVGLVLSLPVVSAAATDAVSTASLWRVAEITVPADIYVTDVKASPTCLCFQTYAFYSDERDTVVLTAHYDVLDDAEGWTGFFSARDIASSKRFMLNGLSAWRFEEGPYTKINLALPKAANCKSTGKEYALLVFARDDSEAAQIAASFRAKKPYPCIHGWPMP